MWSSTAGETTNLLPPSQKINLSNAPIKIKSYAHIYKAIAALICLCLTTIAISSLFKHPTTSDTKLLKAAPSIRGGTDASGLDYPWMASWRFDDIHCCTGSLIHKNPPIIATAGTNKKYISLYHRLKSIHIFSISTNSSFFFLHFYHAFFIL